MLKPVLVFLTQMTTHSTDDNGRLVDELAQLKELRRRTRFWIREADVSVHGFSAPSLIAG